MVAAAIVLFVVGASIWAPSTMDIIGDEDPGGDFQPRTTTPVDVANSYDKPEIELFCALDVDQDVRFQGSADAPFGVLSCPKTAKFKVGYRSSDPALKYAAFFGVDQEGVVYWYGPSPVREESWPVQPREKITPVGDTIELDVNHRPGRVRVYALFTPEPMRHAALESDARARRYCRALRVS